MENIELWVVCLGRLFDLQTAVLDFAQENLKRFLRFLTIEIVGVIEDLRKVLYVFDSGSGTGWDFRADRMVVKIEVVKRWYFFNNLPINIHPDENANLFIFQFVLQISKTGEIKVAHKGIDLVAVGQNVFKRRRERIGSGIRYSHDLSDC